MNETNRIRLLQWTPKSEPESDSGGVTKTKYFGVGLEDFFFLCPGRSRFIKAVKFGLLLHSINFILHNLSH
jgi:hypothetical protein